jgi:hypothetical protein
VDLVDVNAGAGLALDSHALMNLDMPLSVFLLPGLL